MNSLKLELTKKKGTIDSNELNKLKGDIQEKANALRQLEF